MDSARAMAEALHDWRMKQPQVQIEKSQLETMSRLREAEERLRFANQNLGELYTEYRRMALRKEKLLMQIRKDMVSISTTLRILKLRLANHIEEPMVSPVEKRMWMPTTSSMIQEEFQSGDDPGATSAALEHAINMHHISGSAEELEGKGQIEESLDSTVETRAVEEMNSLHKDSSSALVDNTMLAGSDLQEIHELPGGLSDSNSLPQHEDARLADSAPFGSQQDDETATHIDTSHTTPDMEGEPALETSIALDEDACHNEEDVQENICRNLAEVSFGDQEQDGDEHT